MFDDKVITIIKRSKEPVIDEYGKASYQWEEIGDYSADVQPITIEKCKKIFGSYPNVKYQVWLESKINDFNTTDYRIKYNNIEYEVLNIIEWDDDWYCLNFVVGVDLIG